MCVCLRASERLDIKLKAASWSNRAVEAPSCKLERKSCLQGDNLASTTICQPGVKRILHARNLI